LVWDITSGRREKRPRGAGDKKSIAVLPLKPINAANREQIYELGIADSVILKLSSSRNLIVRQLHAVRKYVELDRDVIEIGKEQNVDFVLASNYQIANGKIKVTSQLLDVATGKVEDTFMLRKIRQTCFQHRTRSRPLSAANSLPDSAGLTTAMNQSVEQPARKPTGFIYRDVSGRERR
jgi:TolB-like protein